MLICDTHADTLFSAGLHPEGKREVTLETLLNIWPDAPLASK